MADRKSAASGSGKKPASPAARKSGRTVPAAPLLAKSPKKVGKVSVKSAAQAPKPNAPYQPKTQPPPRGHNSGASARLPMSNALPAIPNPLAIVSPYIRLGQHMVIAGFEMQASIARAALQSPATVAQNQIKAWRSLFGYKA